MSNTAKTIRRNNLRLLVEQAGSQRKLADICNLAPAHVSQIITRARTMGDEVARRIEQELNLDIGWMDVNDHSTPPANSIDRELLFYAKCLSELSSADRKEIFNAIEKMTTKSSLISKLDQIS